VGVNLAEVMAADSIQPIDVMAAVRNAHFKGRITEFTTVMEFNFLDYINHKSEFKFSPYAFFGLGYSFVGGEGRINESLPVEKYSLKTLVIPFGGGVKVLVGPQLTLGVELGFRPTTSDFLDKLDSQLPASPRFETPIDPTSKPLPAGLNYGNPYTKDWYYFLGVTLSYTLTKARCFTY